MTGQQENYTDGHASVSNEPEHRAEVPAAEAISQPPFEGEGFGRVFEESVQQGNEGVEEVPGYEQSRNALTRSLMDPKIVLAAPETIDLRPIAEASFGPLAAGQSSLSDGRSGVLAMQRASREIGTTGSNSQTRQPIRGELTRPC
jgi:hypothetical protein